MHLDGQWFGHINFNAMPILNSIRVRSLFSNILYTIKELKEQNRTDQKQTGYKIDTLILDQVGMLTSADPSSELHPFYCCIT